MIHSALALSSYLLILTAVATDTKMLTLLAGLTGLALTAMLLPLLVIVLVLVLALLVCLKVIDQSRKEEAKKVLQRRPVGRPRRRAL